MTDQIQGEKNQIAKTENENVVSFSSLQILER